MYVQLSCTSLDGATAIEIGIQGVGQRRTGSFQREHNILVQGVDRTSVTEQHAFG